MEKFCQANTSQKKSEVSVLLLYRVDFRKEKLPGIKRKLHNNKRARCVILNNMAPRFLK